MKDLISILEGRNLYGVLQFVAEEYGDAPAITNCGEGQPDHSYKELLRDVEIMAAGMQRQQEIATGINSALGIEGPARTPQHIVLCGRNCYDWIVCFLGAIVSGDVVIPVDADITEQELAKVLENVDATELITDREFEKLRIARLSMDEVREHFRGRSRELEHPDFESSGDDVSILLATSGVTSSPKYVCLSQKNVLYSTFNGMEAVPVEPGLRVLSILPPHHSYEISCGLLYNLCFGSHIYINDEKAKIFYNIKKVCPQCMAAVPTLVHGLAAMLKAAATTGDVSWVRALKIIYCGGAAANSDVISMLYDRGIQVLQGYGMTECSPAITFNYLDDFTPNTVGRVLRFVELRIDDKGEILVKAPNVMKGYYKNPEATEAVLKDGWLATGDIGHFDETGHLILSGRLKNVIVLKTGENVYPEELEELVFQSNLAVQYCKVYDEDGVINVDLYSAQLDEKQLKTIVKEVNDQVSEFKRIKKINVLSVMPKVTSLGKAYRRQEGE